ncbi:MAG: hypothetical protein IPL11_03635 [Candidatus Accumulibacter sp.]|nr:hypothetical protein [Accumulibacter sp.]
MGATGIAAGNPAEQCRVVTETLPASFSQETCNDYRPVHQRFLFDRAADPVSISISATSASSRCDR